ncbi:ubiquitin-conjugating enzyme E2 U [Rattus rattus]|uniref:ubiquitin-conjugating enzyme E2 U n=1 Tax=Rattus rattus TaxID=10117 RepID=UPI0013F36283|nr:ubiquitin-conjugating enzyme E2 U [Rattus rattus]
MSYKTDSKLAVYSKAYSLLEREFKELQNSRSKGINAYPVSSDLMSWKAEIEGLKYSVCEGLVFHLTIDFSQDYNLVPPVVKFVTIPFHPNVHPYTGQPSLGILDKPDMWDPSYTILRILFDLQMLLSYPSVKNPSNLEAAELLVKDESMYRTVIRELLQSEPPKSEGSLVLAEKPQEHIRIIKTISFNDYYKTWSQIATTKVAEHSKNQFVGDPHFMEQYYKWKEQDRQYQRQWESKFVLSKWQNLRKKMAQESSEPSDREEVLYPSPTELSSEPNVEDESGFYKVPQEWSEESYSEEHDSEESWEEEVDNLVAWTDGLDEESLNYENYENYENIDN